MDESKEKIRLQLFLSKAGVASRRKCADLIAKGKVRVNNEIVTEPFYKVDPENDTVEFAGKSLKLKKYQFCKLNKPAGYISTMSDDRGRKSIADLIPRIYSRLFPVGRLDIDSKGLIILTNHGEAANRMMHPRYHFSKVYQVMLDKSPNPDDLIAMSNGIILDDKKTLPASYEKIGKPDSKKIRVEIYEGRKRQIKKMFKAMGYKVVELRRVSMGPIKLGNLSEGEIRELTMQEMFALLDALKLESY